MLEAALEYAGKGWKVFPVNGKIPVTSHGVLDATSSLDQVRSWWGTTTSLGIALATGNGLVVVDIDPKNSGSDSLWELERKHGELPPTLRSITPSGGSHYYFTAPLGIRNSASKIGAGIDVRGDGGYVVLPPSTGYHWDVGGLDAPTSLPTWMLPLLLDRLPVKTASADGSVKFGNGRRNAALASIAGAIRRQGGSFETILAGIRVANAQQCEPPLSEREVEQIARSISRYEPSSPGRGAGYPVRSDSVGGQRPAGIGLPTGGPLRRPGQPRGFFTGAKYLGRRG